MDKTNDQSLLAINQPPLNKPLTSGEVNITVINGQPQFGVVPLGLLAKTNAGQLKHKSLWPGLALALIIWLAPVASHAATYDAAAIIDYCNQARQENGVGGLATNDKLNQAAQLKARDMLTYDYFAHTSPTGATPWSWLAKVDYSFTEAGENLAQDFIDAADIIDAWLHSDSHRNNLLATKFNDIGAAVVNGEIDGRSTILVVVFFGSQRAVVATAPVVETAPIPVPAAPVATPPAAPTDTVTPAPTPMTDVPIALAVQPKAAVIAMNLEPRVPSLVDPDGVLVPNPVFTRTDPDSRYLGGAPLNPRVEGAQIQYGAQAATPVDNLANLPFLILVVYGFQLLVVLVFGLVKNWHLLTPKTTPATA